MNTLVLLIKNQLLLIILVAIAILAYLNPQLSKAQAAPATALEHISVQDCSVDQAKDFITINCDFKNNGAVQTGIRYAIDLVSGEGDAAKLVDEKVYDDALSLATNQSLHKTISYTIPAYVDGKVGVFVRVSNDEGLSIAPVKAGVVTHSATGGVSISDCYLNIAGDETNTKYTLTQGVDISSLEILVAHCSVTNRGSYTMMLLPIFDTHQGNLFGKRVAATGVVTPPLTVEAGKTVEYLLALPKPAQPQSYDVLVTLALPGKPISNTLAMHYVIQGANATVQNITIDKTSYADGDTANVSTLWAGSQEGVSAIAATKIATFITSGKTLCGTSTESISSDKNQSGGVLTIKVPIKGNCTDPVVAVKVLTDKDRVLAEKTIEVPSDLGKADQNRAPNQRKSPLVRGLLALLALLLVAVITFFVIKKKNRNSNIAALMILLLLLPTLFFTNINTSKAEEVKPEWYSVISKDRGLPEGLQSCFDYYRFGSVPVTFISDTSTISQGSQLKLVGTIENQNTYTVDDVSITAKVFFKKNTDKSSYGPDVVDIVTVTEHLNLKVGEKRTVLYTWDVPPLTPPGNYQIAGFVASHDRFNLSGLSFSNDVVGSLFNFNVVGENKGAIRFDNTQTTLNGNPFHAATFAPKTSPSGSSTPVTALIDNTTDTAYEGVVHWKVYSWDALQVSSLVETQDQLFSVSAHANTELTFNVSNSGSTVYYIVGEIDSVNKGPKSIVTLRYVASSPKTNDTARIAFVGATEYPAKKDTTVFACMHSSGAKPSENVKLEVTATPHDLLARLLSLGNIGHKTYSGKAPGEIAALAMPLTKPSNDFSVTATLYQDGKMIDTVTSNYYCKDFGTCSSSRMTEWGIAIAAAVFVLIVAVVVYLLIRRRRRQALVSDIMTTPTN